jgi:hypothetical protein
VLWLDVVAVTLGVLVVGAAAYFVSPLAAQSDPNMVWEARIAAGFAAILPFGVLWTAQVVATLFATLSTDGIRPVWLWIWLLAASALGCSPPAAALARRLVRTPGTDLHRIDAAVAQAANLAWADTIAESGWQLRRTPPGITEVAAPWGRISWGAGAATAPVVERMSDAVGSIGWQGSQPTAPVSGRRPTQAALIDAIWNGDPKDLLVRELRQWQDRNAVIAAQPFVAPHLPRAAAS